MAGVNKTIWITWFQGWDLAPNVAQKCLESWKYHNPDWEVVCLDKNNYKEYCKIDEVLPGLDTNYISLGDILRLFLMKEHGGVWVDATCFCNKPLDSWVHDIEDSFVFTQPGRMIASWFVAAHEGSRVIDTWYNKMVEFWTYRIKETDQFEQQYGWIHSLFRSSYEDKDVKAIVDSWDKIDCRIDPQRRGRGPHLFAPYEYTINLKVSPEISRRIDSKVDPLYKLSYKINTDWRSKDAKGIHPSDDKIEVEVLPGTELDYLFNTLK